MSKAPLTALEIGTTTVKVLMGEVREDDGLTVLGIGETASRGVRKGEIVDFEMAIGVVQRALELAEENSSQRIGEAVYLTVSGARAESLLHWAGIPVFNEYGEPGGEVTADEIEQLTEMARKVPVPADRLRLHTLQQYFEVDGRGGIVNPEGMLARELRLGMLAVHGQASVVQNLKRLAENVPLTCTDAAFGGLCSALAVLTSEQKRSGAVVVDLGGGTTDYVVFSDGLIKLAGSFAIGGDHVTADISSGLNINRRQAEKLKRDSGSAVINRMESDQNLSIPAEGGFSGRVVRAMALHTIINVRMEETFGLVAGQIEENGLNGVLSAGVIVTGGGSALAGITDLGQQVFNAPCRVGRPREVTGLSTKNEGARFAAALGCLRYAAGRRIELPKRRFELAGWVKKLWSGSHG